MGLIFQRLQIRQYISAICQAVLRSPILISHMIHTILPVQYIPAQAGQSPTIIFMTVIWTPAERLHRGLVLPSMAVIRVLLNIIVFPKWVTMQLMSSGQIINSTTMRSMNPTFCPILAAAALAAENGG